MKRNELLKKEYNIIRVLELKENWVLIINCCHQDMPKWVSQTEFKDYTECNEEELTSSFQEKIRNYDSLSQSERRIAHERFTLIAGVLPFINDSKRRCSMITYIAEEKRISKQTIRHYLWLYLVYQDISALAPKSKQRDRPLTTEQKNMRWAINKYFYNRYKRSLSTAYTMMLKERYCDSSGKLLPNHPSLSQFRYYFKKHKKLQNYYISREGLKAYQRNHRPLVGGGVQEFAPYIGTGMLDSTICDIYLVDEKGNLVGRPILTGCVDAFSGLCCGYFLGWEGGVYSLRGLMTNVITDKIEWCSRFGISIQHGEWDCNQLPAILVTDKGNEYQSETFAQLAELGVTVVNLPAYRPDLKSCVEKFFDEVQVCFKEYLKGKGIIESDFQERGAKDYRLEACLTLKDFERILLHCIIYYNTQRIIEDFPFTNEMLEANVKPTSNSIWSWGKKQSGANLISVNYEELVLTLLPRTTGKFSRRGLIVNKLRYKGEGFTERYLEGGNVIVAYNPEDLSFVWLFESGNYYRFELIESRYEGMNIEEVEVFKSTQRDLEKSMKAESLQAKIDLARHIEVIANTAKVVTDTNIKRIRQTRAAEQRRTHIDFMEGGEVNNE